MVFPEFWTGKTGRELRTAGKDAQLLGLYLATNRFANMIGLYKLLPEDIHHETRLSLKGIAGAFDATAAAHFATYDAATGYVWVRTMARIRLNLTPGSSLSTEDKRVPAVNRLYQALDPNPFLGEFFDLNHRTLRLKRRREPSATLVVPLNGRHHISPLQGARKGHASQ